MNPNDRKQRQPTQNQPAPAALNRAIQRLLRPLVKLLLSFQITYPVVQEWLKKAMVDVAERDFPLTDKPQTDTRLSLLTGIHRKDIKRLRGNSTTATSDGTSSTAAAPEQTSGQAPEVVSLGVQIAAHWMSQWRDDQGQPKVLPFKRQPDESPSFEALVERVAKKDIRARVVLDEWLRLGAVSEVILDGEPQLQLTPGAFIPSKGLDEKAFFLGMNLADHIATTSHNLLLDEAKFERCLYYDGLSPESVEELKQLAAEQGMALLTRLNQRALELKQQDQTGSHTHRINVGLYVFDEDERHEPGQ